MIPLQRAVGTCSCAFEYETFPETMYPTGAHQGVIVAAGHKGGRSGRRVCSVHHSDIARVAPRKVKH